MTEAIAAAAKALLKKLAADLVLDKGKRNKFLLIVGSIVVGLIFLLMTPIVVLSRGLTYIRQHSGTQKQKEGKIEKAIPSL